jgi:hypothetical protein
MLMYIIAFFAHDPISHLFGCLVSCNFLTPKALTQSNPVLQLVMNTVSLPFFRYSRTLRYGVDFAHLIVSQAIAFNLVIIRIRQGRTIEVKTNGNTHTHTLPTIAFNANSRVSQNFNTSTDSHSQSTDSNIAGSDNIITEIKRKSV